MNPLIAVRDRLLDDTSLVALLTGGIYTRNIVREGRGATPQAFDANLWLKPSATVEGGAENNAVAARGNATNFGVYSVDVTVHFYAPSDSTRLAIIDQAYERTIKVIKLGGPDSTDLTPWWFVNDDGRRMFPTGHSSLGPYPSEVFIGSSERLLTFRFTGTRKAY